MNKEFEKTREELLAYLAVRNYSAATLSSIRMCLGRFFRFLEKEGVEDLREVGRDTLKAYQIHLKESDTPLGGKMVWSSRCTYFRAVRRLYGWMENTKQIFLNPTQFIQDANREERLPKGVMTEEEVRKAMEEPDLSTPSGFRDRAIMEVFYSTGIRLNEMVNLKMGDIDLQEKVVRVNLGKGAKDRVVPVGEKACGFVERYLKEVRVEWVREVDAPQELWVTRWGQPLRAHILRINVRHYARKAGIRGRVTCHAFRHAFATHMIRNGADVAAVSKMLGHAGTRVTHLYTHLAAADVKKAHDESHPREREGRSGPEDRNDLAEGKPEISRMMRMPLAQTAEDAGAEGFHE